MLLKAGPLEAERSFQFPPRCCHARVLCIPFLLTEHQDGVALQAGFAPVPEGRKAQPRKSPVPRDLLIFVGSKYNQRSGFPVRSQCGMCTGCALTQDRPGKDDGVEPARVGCGPCAPPEAPCPEAESLRGSNPRGAAGVPEPDCSSSGHVHLRGCVCTCSGARWEGQLAGRRLSLPPAPQGARGAQRELRSEGRVCPPREAAALINAQRRWCTCYWTYACRYSHLLDWHLARSHALVPNPDSGGPDLR